MTEQLLNFISFTNKFQHIKRILFVTDEDRDENDAEHSFQLAFVAWYLIAAQKLKKYDINKVIKYAIVHDLVETYAGDTYFEADQKSKDTKHLRESKALQKITQDFAEFPEMIELINKYEERKDNESKFVYTLDKMLPVLNIYLDKGRSWKRDKVSFEMIRNKDKKIKENKDVMKTWMKFMELVEKDRKQLFNE